MRKAEISLLYNNLDINASRDSDAKYKEAVDISKNIADCLIEFRYNDNEQGKADDLEITLENRDSRWLSSWLPDKGSRLTAGLKLYDWKKEGDNFSVNYGKFSIDEIEVSSNGTFKINAIASECETRFKNERKNRQWDNISLKQLAAVIAAENNMELSWKSKAETVYPCITQNEETDAEMLAEKLQEAGIKIKINQEKIIIYDDVIGNSGLTITPQNLTSYNLKSKTFGVYDAARVSYMNPQNNKVERATVTDEEFAKKKMSRTLSIDIQAESYEEAEEKARAELKRHNEREITGSFETIGNPALWSGEEIELKGFGKFDGEYICESVTHTINRSGGYKTSVNIVLKKGENGEEE